MAPESVQYERLEGDVHHLVRHVRLALVALLGGRYRPVVCAVVAVSQAVDRLVADLGVDDLLDDLHVDELLGDVGVDDEEPEP